jgi:4-hydroxy-tetrahydrodipicolinate synthase
LPILSIGGHGVVSVVGNLVPQDVNRLLKNFASGRTGDAATLHMRLFPLCRDLLGAATNPIPIKTAMMLLGRDSGELRLPLCRPDNAVEGRIRQSLEDYGLLKSSELEACSRS